MDITQESVKDWLKSIKKDRSWLAEQCGVKKRQVDNWLSTSVGIPPRAALLIEKLIEDHQKETLPVGKLELGTSSINLEIPTDILLEFKAAADKAGLSLEEWVLAVVSYASQHEDKIFEYIETHGLNSKSSRFQKPA